MLQLLMLLKRDTAHRAELITGVLTKAYGAGFYV